MSTYHVRERILDAIFSMVSKHNWDYDCRTVAEVPDLKLQSVVSTRWNVYFSMMIEHAIVVGIAKWLVEFDAFIKYLYGTLVWTA